MSLHGLVEINFTNHNKIFSRERNIFNYKFQSLNDVLLHEEIRQVACITFKRG